MPPLAAVREGATLPKSRFAFLRLPGSILLTVLGFAALSWSLFGPGLSTTSLLVWMGVGALMIFLGVALLAERLVRPLATALGWPAAKLGGAAGVLARENTQRNPQRTASTASALMIGLALVTLVTLLAAGIVTTFKSAVDDLWKNADYAVTAQNNFSPIPVSVAASRGQGARRGRGRERQGRPGEGLRQRVQRDRGRPPDGADLLARLEGRLRRGARPPRQRRRFRRRGLRGRPRPEVGSTFRETFPNGESAPFRVLGIFKPPTGGSPFGPVTISANTWDRFNDQPQNLYSFVIMKGGETDANKAALDRTLREFPNAKVQTRQEFVDNQISGLSSVLNILYVLLALSVLVELLRDREHARADGLRADA